MIKTWPNPFDLDGLRTADLNDIAVEKILTTVPVKRPGKDQFFRIHSGSEFTLDTYVLDHESDMDRTTYLAAPILRLR